MCPTLPESGPPQAAAGPGTQRERLFPQHRRHLRKCSGVKQNGRPRGLTSEHLPERCWTVSLGNSGVFVAPLSNGVGILGQGTCFRIESLSSWGNIFHRSVLVFAPSLGPWPYNLFLGKRRQIETSEFPKVLKDLSVDELHHYLGRFV